MLDHGRSERDLSFTFHPLVLHSDRELRQHRRERFRSLLRWRIAYDIFRHWGVIPFRWLQRRLTLTINSARTSSRSSFDGAQQPYSVVHHPSPQTYSELV